jgi:hypothetical protein
VRLLAPDARVNSVQPAGASLRLPRSLGKEVDTLMKLNSVLRSLGLAIALASTVTLLAKPINKTISITHAAKLGKADLQAGEYRLSIDGTKATVEKGKQMIAQSEGRWEDRSNKAASDSVLIGEDGQVKEVRFAGQNRVFVFNE